MADLSIIANLIADWKAREPDLDVLTFVDIAGGQFEHETRSYAQLWENAQKLARWLVDQGLQKGDSFALVMANHPEFVDFMVASSIVGTVFVPVDPRSKGDRLSYMLNYAECKGAVVADDAMANVESVWQGDERWILPLQGMESVATILQQPVADDLPVAVIDPGEPMQMLYTSGTTGDPKAILSPYARYGVAAGVAQILGLDREDRPYTGLSLTHANAQVLTLGATLFLGMRGVISRRFSKSRLWDLTRVYGCTWFNLLGGMTTAVYAEPHRANDADNPVRMILSAGMPAAIWQDFETRFDIKLSEFYGAAEGGLSFNIAGAGPVGSCGRAPPNLVLKIFNPAGEECAPGEAGEICFQDADGAAPHVEYFKNPEASARKTAGGWLRMGDIGHVDDNGWLFFHYRDGGGIRRNGEFINPAFVEKALSELDCVDDVFVYGVPVENGAPGEKDPVAAIVPRAQGLDVAQIVYTCRENLEKNLIPRYLHIVDEIPKTASEKPIERFLLDTFDIDQDYIKDVMAYE